MNYLRDADIRGKFEDVQRLTELFGMVWWDNLGGNVHGGPRTKLTIVKIEPNHYAKSLAKLQDDPLFLVAPDQPVDAVWPCHSHENVRFGTATNADGKICRGVYMTAQGTTAGLYFALDPGGMKLDKGLSLGV